MISQNNLPTESPVPKQNRNRSSSWGKIPRKLGTLDFAVLCYFCVSGGAFGCEGIVRAGGPFVALCGFSLVLVWSVPEILITAELATTLPGPSGSVNWVHAAWGPYWSFQFGWLSWLSGIADNSLYPAIFVDCLREFMTVREKSYPTTLPSEQTVKDTSLAPFLLHVPLCFCF